MGVAIARKEALSPVQALVKEALGRLEADYDRRGERLIMRRLELQHGISNGTIGQLLKGQRKGVSAATAKRIQKLLGIPWEPLVWTGKGSEDALPSEPSATPPAPTVRRIVVNEEVERLVDQAFDGSRHRPSDARAVLEMLEGRAALLDDGADVLEMIGDWLDVAARLRQRDQKATPEAIFSGVTKLGLERRRLLNEQAAEESRAQGYEPPAEVPAAVRALQKKKPSRGD